MRPTLLMLVVLSVLLSSGSQILLKFGMSSAAVRAVLDSGASYLQIGIAIATSPYVICGMISFGLSALVWLFVLARIPLSTAYPFVALGIAVTVTAGWCLFDEPISYAKLVGVSLILIGITTVSVSS